MQNAIRSRRICRLSGKYFCGKKDGCPPFSHKAIHIATPRLRRAQKSFEEKSKKQLTKSISHAKISKSSGERTHKNEYGRVPEWPMGTDCKSAAFSFGGSNPPAPTKKTSVENTLVFCFIRYLKFHPQGWIRTAAATSLKTAQKQPSGLFLAARLAISTRAHQKTSAYESTLRFLFYCKVRLTGRVDLNNSGADRRLRRKQGGEAGAAASRMRVPPKARRSRWEPRPGFLFILRGARHPPAPTKKLNVSRCIPLFLFHLSLKAALPCRVTKKDALRSLAKRLCL